MLLSWRLKSLLKNKKLDTTSREAIAQILIKVPLSPRFIRCVSFDNSLAQLTRLITLH